MRGLRALLAIVALAIGTAADAQPLRVFAASSLTESFRALEPTWRLSCRPACR